CKRQWFTGVARNAVGIELFELLAVKLLLEQVPEEPIANAAATEENPGWKWIDRQEPAERTGHAASHEGRGGAQHVVQRPDVLFRELHGLLREFIAESLPRHALGRPTAEVGVGEPAVEQRFKATSLNGVFAAGVKGLAASRQPAHQAVQKNVARP